MRIGGGVESEVGAGSVGLHWYYQSTPLWASTLASG